LFVSFFTVAIGKTPKDSHPTRFMRGGRRKPVVQSHERGPSPSRRLKDANPRRKLGTQFPICNSDVVLGLEVQPEPGLHAEEQSESKRGVRGDGALAIDQLADPARRNIDVRRKLASADAHGLHEILQQDFARMNLI